MNKEEVQLLGFEIVAYAGDARSNLIEALKAAENGDFAENESLVRKRVAVSRELTNLKRPC